jgi:sulfofructose kinase
MSNPLASPTAPLVIVLGSVVVDHAWVVDDIPQRPTKSTARGYSMGVGGLAANAAIAVARLGGRIAFWGRLGDDANGPVVADALAALVARSLRLGLPAAAAALLAVLALPLDSAAVRLTRRARLALTAPVPLPAAQHQAP